MPPPLEWCALTLVATALSACRTRQARALPPRPADAAVALPPGVIRGVSYAHDWAGRGARGYGTASDVAQLRALRDLGCDWVSVTPFGYLRSPSDDRVVASYERRGAETDAALRATIDRAHALGMRVLLKPHLWIRGSWPGALRAERRDRCETLASSWGELTVHYADLAAQTGSEALTIAVEMDGLARDCPDAWRALIARVRDRYRGTLVWAANWSEPEALPFWDALDVIGVDHYAPLADAPGAADRAVAFGRARAAMARYAALGRRLGKPVWLTEVGFRRDDAALVEPWAWPGARRGADGVDLQSLGYEATFRAVAETPEVRGVFLWKWFTSGGTEDEGEWGYVFNGRPAEARVRAAFGL